MIFEIVPGDASSPYVIHVPHSSTRIPDDVRTQLLLDDDELAERLLLKRFFTPYAEALADLIDQRLAATDHAVLVDLHSYPVAALPYELHQEARRPPVCLGVDVDHTPAALRERAFRACSVIGQVVVNEPFAGSYIPLRHFGRDNRVSSVMVELRRDTYMRDDGSMDPEGARRVSDALAAILGA